MKKKVVIIDDEMDIVEALVDLIELEQIDALAFSDPQKALEYLLSNNDYDCIICDINMPTLSGIDLFKKYRQNAFHQVPFIFNSGHAEFLKQIRPLVEQYPDTIFVCKPDIDLIQKTKELLNL